ncbi:cyclic GMP-AMP synthase-like isoform X1 [Mytilus trossulus]|uniref:cyclic GMP-AMP synthase-like isoform X1 n=1 Tax=Mytilus trossulus TaxID=6551 RepID=UPI0030053CC6
MKRSEHKQSPKCEGSKSNGPNRKQDAQENKRRPASAKSKPETKKTHEPSTSKQGQPTDKSEKQRSSVTYLIKKQPVECEKKKFPAKTADKKQADKCEKEKSSSSPVEKKHTDKKEKQKPAAQKSDKKQTDKSEKQKSPVTSVDRKQTDKSEQQKPPPKTLDKKPTDKCVKEKSQSTSLDKETAKDRIPVNTVIRERFSGHQDKCKLSMEEVSPAAKTINSFIDDFIQKLKEISTLNWNSFRSGSYYDKTKNCHPDEFDIMFYPELSVEVDFDDMKIPGFYKVKMVSPRVPELEHVLDKDRYIVPDKFKKYVFGLFDRVLGPDGIRQGRRTKRKSTLNPRSPAYTVYYDAFPGKSSIDIDLVPSFYITGWPPEKIARKINPSWISLDDVVNKAMISYDVVCKTCPEGAADKNLLFRLSFSRTEKMLVKHANSADKLNFKKTAFRFIKLCIQDLKEKHPRKVEKFCSYHIKQFMFSQYDTWPTRESEEVRIQRCLIGELIKTLSLPTPTILNYIIKNDNVIRYVSSEEIAVIVKGLQEKFKLLH